MFVAEIQKCNRIVLSTFHSAILLNSLLTLIFLSADAFDFLHLYVYIYRFLFFFSPTFSVNKETFVSSFLGLTPFISCSHYRDYYLQCQVAVIE